MIPEYEKFKLMKITNLYTGTRKLLYETDTIKNMKWYINKHNIEPDETIVIEMDNAHENTTKEVYVDEFIREAGKTFKEIYGAYTLRRFV